MPSTALALAGGLAPVVTERVYPDLVEVLVPVSRGTADQAAQALQGVLPGIVDASVAARLGTLSDRVDRAIDPDELAVAQRDTTSSLARVLTSISSKGVRVETLEEYIVTLSPRLSSWISTNDDVPTATAKVKQAVAYCMEVKKPLVFDAGRIFTFNERIFSSGDFVMLGENVGTSEVRWVAGSANGGGWDHENFNPKFTSTFTAKNLLLTTLDQGIGKALHVHATGITAADRITTTVHIADVTVRGASHPRSDGWRDGIHSNGCVQTAIDRVVTVGFINGSGLPSAGVGIRLDNEIGAAPHPGGYVVNESQVQQYAVGIKAYDFESCYVKGGGIQGCAIGLWFGGPDTFPQAHFIGGHINATSICVLVDRMRETQIICNDFYLENVNTGGTSGRTYHIKYINGAGYGNCFGNTFVNFSGTQACTNVYVETGAGLLVGPNIHISSNSDPNQNPNEADRNNGIPADGTGIGVHFASGADSCRAATGNVFRPNSHSQTVRSDSGTSVIGLAPDEMTNSFIAWMRTLPVWDGGDTLPVPKGLPYLMGPGGPVVIAQ